MTDPIAAPRPSWMDALAPYAEGMDGRVPLKRQLHMMSGKTIVGIPAVTLRLPRWEGAPFADDLGKKSSAMIELDGEHLFAELAVLRLLEKQGWSGRWVNTQGAKGEVWKYLTRWDDVPRDEQRTRNIEEEEPRRMLARIAARSKKRYGGCWDVYAWRGDEYAFLQTKRAARDGDEVKELQVDWLHTALLLSDPRVNLDSFGFVQWDFV
ncbi:MAG: hypothetical protein JWM27_4620 [Gemmatimonadetes bacterium]|nr:hypothetical protein [Gemmatimonadota bacterium]